MSTGYLSFGFDGLYSWGPSEELASQVMAATEEDCSVRYVAPNYPTYGAPSQDGIWVFVVQAPNSVPRAPIRVRFEKWADPSQGRSTAVGVVSGSFTQSLGGLPPVGDADKPTYSGWVWVPTPGVVASPGWLCRVTVGADVGGTLVVPTLAAHGWAMPLMRQGGNDAHLATLAGSAGFNDTGRFALGVAPYTGATGINAEASQRGHSLLVARVRGGATGADSLVTIGLYGNPWSPWRPRVNNQSLPLFDASPFAQYQSTGLRSFRPSSRGGLSVVPEFNCSVTCMALGVGFVAGVESLSSGSKQAVDASNWVWVEVVQGGKVTQRSVPLPRAGLRMAYGDLSFGTAMSLFHFREPVRLSVGVETVFVPVVGAWSPPTAALTAIGPLDTGVYSPWMDDLTVMPMYSIGRDNLPWKPALALLNTSNAVTGRSANIHPAACFYFGGVGLKGVSKEDIALSGQGSFSPTLKQTSGTFPF